MKQTIIYVGLDVDDTQCHGCALNKETGEILSFKCRPTLKGLLGQLDKLGTHFAGCAFKLCYEASYIGYTLQQPREGVCHQQKLQFPRITRQTRPQCLQHEGQKGIEQRGAVRQRGKIAG